MRDSQEPRVWDMEREMDEWMNNRWETRMMKLKVKDTERA
jgi:hypothetical protein